MAKRPVRYFWHKNFSFRSGLRTSGYWPATIGTDELYLGYVSQFVRPGGSLGIVVPSVIHELNGEIPAYLSPYWQWDWWSFHSPQWWQQHWEKTGLVEVERADTIPNGWKHWLTWLEVCLDAGFPSAPEEIEMLRADAGRTFGFTRVVGRKRLEGESISRHAN